MNILIFGSRGFIGKHLCSQLKKNKKYTIYTFDRKPGDKNHIQGNITKKHDVISAIKGKDIVINLIGLTPLKEPKNTTYDLVHVQGIKNIIKGVKQNKCKKIIQLSALGANSNSQIDYIRTKDKAEELIKKSNLDYCIIRPSIINGEGSELETMISRYPFMVFPKVVAKVQPVDVENVVNLIMNNIITKKNKNIVNAAGDTIMTMCELVQMLCKKQNKFCILIPLWIVKIGMNTAKLIPGTGISKNQILSLELDSVVKKEKSKK